MRKLLRSDGGQAIILVAFGLVVLLGTVALVLDWGYGLTQRRVSQNTADAAAIAAAKALATNTDIVGTKIAFRLSQESLYCVAEQYADLNRLPAFLPNASTTILTLQISPDGTPASWADVPAVSDCSTSLSAGTDIPSGTTYVRATSGITYRSLLAAVLGQPEIHAEASARARIAGGTMGDGPVWPMVRHYNPNDFDETTNCDKKKCDPETVAPFMFWSSTGAQHDMVYGDFKGLVDYSRYSSRFPSEAPVPQLITSWDQTGSPEATPPTAKKDDPSSKCDPQTNVQAWDTQGAADPDKDKQCSIPNWAYYAFGGRLSLDSRWDGEAVPEAQRPHKLGSRSICTGLPDGLDAPSCGSGNDGLGDWVETPSGDLGRTIGRQLSDYIALHGVPMAYTDQLIPGTSIKHGNGVVIFVYLWDCAESFDKSWTPAVPTGDCSQIKESGSASVDRVHLFTAAPFTFYQNLVSTEKIQGYWGGGFADPSSCEAEPDSCPAVNAFINTAFLVADEPSPDNK